MLAIGNPVSRPILAVAAAVSTLTQLGSQKILRAVQKKYTGMNTDFGFVTIKFVL
jgi:hypothetical protein